MCPPVLRRNSYIFPFAFHIVCKMKLVAGNQISFKKAFQAPPFDVACTALVVPLGLCSSTSRLFEIISTGDENSYKTSYHAPVNVLVFQTDCCVMGQLPLNSIANM